jgi:hypothetical protein
VAVHQIILPVEGRQDKVEDRNNGNEGLHKEHQRNHDGKGIPRDLGTIGRVLIRPYALLGTLRR